jgi:hypothetical protein
MDLRVADSGVLHCEGQCWLGLKAGKWESVEENSGERSKGVSRTEALILRPQHVTKRR